MPTDISSMQNPKIKRLQSLQQKSSERCKAHLFVVGGAGGGHLLYGKSYQVIFLRLLNIFLPSF